MKSPNKQNSKFIVGLKYLSPKYWGSWAYILLCHLIAFLPLQIQLKLGIFFGKWLSTNKKLSHIAKTNITRCFPDLSEQESSRIINQCFVNQGIDLFETFTLWCRNGFKVFDTSIEIEGLSHMQDALKQDRGIILLASHFSNVDMGAMLMSYIGEKSNSYRFSVTYRPQPNKLVDSFMTRGRKQYFKKVIPVDDIRQISRELKNGQIVWYAPDMNVAKKNAVFIPFLGVQASTTTAISRLARMTNSLVIPYFHHRSADRHHYHVKIYPPLENFPTSDVLADTKKANQLLEQTVSAEPEKYWWILRRFKTRPAGEKEFY